MALPVLRVPLPVPVAAGRKKKASTAVAALSRASAPKRRKAGERKYSAGPVAAATNGKEVKSRLHAVGTEAAREARQYEVRRSAVSYFSHIPSYKVRLL